MASSEDAPSSASMALASPTWPPPSLANTNVFTLINECEEAEMRAPDAAGVCDVVLTHLTALLYCGEYVHVRHLMRRNNFHVSHDALLQEWWITVALPMLEENPHQAMQGLQHLSENAPSPYNTHAAEIATIYHQRNKDQLQRGDKLRQHIPTASMVAFLETSLWSNATTTCTTAASTAKNT